MKTLPMRLTLILGTAVAMNAVAFEVEPIYGDSVQSGYDTACSETQSPQAIIVNWTNLVHGDAASIRVNSSQAALCFYFDHTVSYDEVAAVRFWVYPESAGLDASIFIHFTTGSSIPYTLPQLFGSALPANTWSQLTAAIPTANDTRQFSYFVFRFEQPDMIVYFDDIDLIGQNIFANGFD